MSRKKDVRKKEIRESVRRFYIISLIIIMILSVYVLYGAFNGGDKKGFVTASVYEYNNKYFYNYDISMIDNEYLNKDNQGDKDIFVSNLMDVASVNMTYSYSANQSADIHYKYRVIGNLEATYSKEGVDQKVLKDTETIVDFKEFDVNSDLVEVSESFEIDMAGKIQKINDLQEELGMQLATKYTVLMEIVTESNVLDQEIVNTFSPDLVFDISPKTTTVSSSTEDTSTPQVVTKVADTDGSVSGVRVTIASITFIAAGALIVVICLKTVAKNSIRNEYKIELNKILKGCEEKIVKVNSKIDFEGQSVVDVREFDEIIKVSEELFKPILYWNNDDEEESWFCVLGNNMVYRFVLKR